VESSSAKSESRLTVPWRKLPNARNEIKPACTSSGIDLARPRRSPLIQLTANLTGKTPSERIPSK
jgi:hypothetical protein